MMIPAAYLGVILIWTTTPLAIKWSGEGSQFLFAVLARMLIGAVLCLLLLRLTGTRLPRHRAARLSYLICGAGIAGSMLLTYWAAQYIPSGWISLIFGLNPILTGVAAALLLGERSLTPTRIGGMLLGFAGLLVVFGFGAMTGESVGLGIAAVLGATLIHCLSAIWVKRFSTGVPALAVTAGGVTVAALLLLASWLLAGAPWPQVITPRAGWSIVYLGMAGSVLGFVLYFHLLQSIEATRVALITLITPVSALLLGHLFNGEPLTAQIGVGTLTILSGLVLFQFGHRLRLPQPGRS